MKQQDLMYIALKTCFLGMTITTVSSHMNSMVHYNSTNLQCTRTSWSQLAIVGNPKDYLIYQLEETGNTCFYCNYICNTGYLSAVVDFQHIVPIETVRLLIICNATSTMVSHLPPGSLKHLKNLIALGFFNCKFNNEIKIGEWLQGILTTSVFLQNLKSTSAETTVNFTDSLYDNPKLELAKLSENALTTLPTSLLCKWIAIKQLWLNNNHITDLSFLYTACSDITKYKLPLQSLEELSVSQNYLTTITLELLTSFPNLHTLYLQDNKIYTIQTTLPVIADNLKFSPIRRIDLDNNALHNLQVCKVLPVVVSLAVSGNPLECSQYHSGWDDCKAILLLSLENYNATLCARMWKVLSLMPQLKLVWLSQSDEKILDFQQLPKGLRFLELEHCHIQTLTDINNISAELSLVYIDMEGNNLTHLDYFSFPPTLISLNLGFNQIGSIEPRVFNQCLALSFIALHNNRLTDISGMFSFLSKLSNLYLQNNNIIRFDYSLIPTSLYYLSLSNNEITEITDDNGVLHDIHLHYLNLSSNHFITLNQDSLAPSIFNLDLSNCEIDSIDADAFRNLNFKYYAIVENFTAHNVRNPYLTQDQISSTTRFANNDTICNTVPFVCSCECSDHNMWLQPCCNTYNTTSLFRSYLYFEFTLSLSHLTYCLVETSCFDLCSRVGFYNYSYQYQAMNKLYCNSSIDNIQLFHAATPTQRNKSFLAQRGLILSHMNVSELKDGAFEEFLQLVILNLANNLLQEIPKLAFRNLRNLTKLYLNENELVRISDFAFKDLLNLVSLWLNCNRLEHLRKHVFFGLQSLCSLRINMNSISRLPKYTFASLTSLELLDLSTNQIQHIQRLSFAGLIKLQKLYLNENRINVVQDFGFTELIHLEELYLQYNAITSISNYTFDGLLNLRNLHLYGNQIAHIHENSFGGISSLRQLLLHDNQLVQWSVRLPTSITNLTISQNRFPCDCKSVFLLRDELSLIPPHVHTDTDKNQCTFQNTDTAHQSVENITDKDCDNRNITEWLPEFPIAAAVIPAIIALLCLCAITALYIYRLEVQVLLYAKFNVRVWAQKPDDGHDKIYDAFISYSNNDRYFIADQLLPMLENKYHLCIHERDFLVGAYIANTIVEVVEKSCRTLVILSPTFVQSEWCLFEFKSAHYQSLKDKCCRLIIIVLEKVDVNLLNSELRAYMRTNTFLCWGDPLFWEKLKYSLPEKKLIETHPSIP